MPTVSYSRVGPLDIKLDYETPPSVTNGNLGAIVYLHGGGIIAGSRNDALYPDWMKGAQLISDDSELTY